MSIEARKCASGDPSKHWQKLKEDMVNLKSEYERLCNRVPYNPTSTADAEKATARSFTDKMLGRDKPE